MSLAVGIWESPERYVLACDSRVSFGDGSMCGTTQKTLTIGKWIGATAGAMPGCQRLARALTATVEGTPELGDATSRAAIEALLDAVHEAVLPSCGAPEPGNYPGTGAVLLLVGPAGIVEFDGAGCVIWIEPVAGGAAYHAIGCADEYAVGCLDSWDGDEEIDALAETVVNMAARRFPGVGGPVVVLKGPA